MRSRTVAADQVMLDVGLTLNDQKVSYSQLITNSGEESEIRIKDLLRATIVPTQRPDGKVFVELQRLEFNGSDYVLSASPKMLTGDNAAAEIATTTGKGNRFRLRITPHELRKN